MISSDQGHRGDHRDHRQEGGDPPAEARAAVSGAVVVRARRSARSPASCRQSSCHSCPDSGCMQQPLPGLLSHERGRAAGVGHVAARVPVGVGELPRRSDRTCRRPGRGTPARPGAGCSARRARWSGLPAPRTGRRCSSAGPCGPAGERRCRCCSRCGRPRGPAGGSGRSARRRGPLFGSLSTTV